MINKLLKYYQTDLVKNFFIYTIGAIFLKGITFFLIPIYTKVLTPFEFGQLELINNLITILTILLSFGLPQLLFIEYYHVEKEEKTNYVKRIISVYFYSATPLFLLIYIIFLNFNIFEIANHKVLIISFAMLFSYLVFFQSILFSILQLEKKAILLTKYKVLSGISIAILNIILIYYLRTGIVGILFTNFIILFISLILILPNIKSLIKDIKTTRFQAKKQILNKIHKGFPFIISSLSFWLITGIDKWIILYYLDQYYVGIYSIAYKFAVVYEPLLIAPILAVYSPYVFEKFKNKNFDQNPFLIFILTVLGFILLGIISFFAAKIMVDESFKEAFYLIPFLVFGISFTLLAQMFGSLMVFRNKSKLLILNVLISSIINIIANIYFVKEFQLIGAAIAFILSNFIWFCLTLYQNIKLKREIESNLILEIY